MSKRFQLFTNIAIGILAFLLLSAIGLTATVVMDDLKPYTVPESSFIYSLQDQRYSDLVRMYHQNKSADAEATESMKNCYAIAVYYEASLNYHAALKTGDEELKKKSEEIMAESAKQMGDFSYAKDEIDEILNR